MDHEMVDYDYYLHDWNWVYMCDRTMMTMADTHYEMAGTRFEMVDTHFEMADIRCKQVYLIHC